MTAHLIIRPPQASPTHSAIRHSDGVTACVYSRFSLEGWGEVSDEASSAFSLQLSNRLSGETSPASRACGDLAQATFVDIAAHYPSEFPEWTTCEFVALLLGVDSVTLHWIGNVHGFVRYDEITLAHVVPHFLSVTSASGEQAILVPNYLSLQNRGNVETRTAELPPLDGTLFAYIGSAGLQSGLEIDLQQMASSAFRSDLGARGVRVSLGKLHGVCLKY